MRPWFKYSLLALPLSAPAPERSAEVNVYCQPAPTFPSLGGGRFFQISLSGPSDLAVEIASLSADNIDLTGGASLRRLQVAEDGVRIRASWGDEDVGLYLESGSNGIWRGRLVFNKVRDVGNLHFAPGSSVGLICSEAKPWRPDWSSLARFTAEPGIVVAEAPEPFCARGEAKPVLN